MRICRDRRGLRSTSARLGRRARGRPELWTQTARIPDRQKTWTISMGPAIGDFNAAGTATWVGCPGDPRVLNHSSGAVHVLTVRRRLTADGSSSAPEVPGVPERVRIFGASSPRCRARGSCSRTASSPATPRRGAQRCPDPWLRPASGLRANALPGVTAPCTGPVLTVSSGGESCGQLVGTGASSTKTYSCCASRVISRRWPSVSATTNSSPLIVGSIVMREIVRRRSSATRRRSSTRQRRTRSRSLPSRRHLAERRLT